MPAVIFITARMRVAVNMPAQKRWMSAGFSYQMAEKIAVLRGWGRQETGPWLRAMLNASCHYYGNGLGPDYNAAHANHFHLGMRGYGVCR